jgi:hypothetical protein
MDHQPLLPSKGLHPCRASLLGFLVLCREKSGYPVTSGYRNRLECTPWVRQ